MTQSNFNLGPLELHVWRADLDRAAEELSALTRVLSPDELARADRFKFERDRNRFIAARGILRELLGRYVRAGAVDLAFEYGARGKPHLGMTWAESGLRFNVAHSQGLGLFGMVRDYEVGVDVECFRSVSVLEIAQRFFAPPEYAFIRNLSPEDQQAGFFRCWTRKEAFIKAIGDGLSYPLDGFEVSLRLDEPARIVWHMSEQPGRWAMWDLPVGNERCGAVVIDGPACRLTVMDWVRT